MVFRNVKAILFSAVLISGLLIPALPGSADETAPGVKAAPASHVTGKTHRKKTHQKKAHAAAKASLTDGTHHPEAARGTQWVTFDDGSREVWGRDTGATSAGAAGNKFTSTWGSFYVDMMSAYVKWNGSGTSLYFSAWTGSSSSKGTKGVRAQKLVGNASLTVTGLSVATGTGWVQVDGSVTPRGWIGNSTQGFSNTAWLGVYVSSHNDVGIDTNGGGTHGFYVDYYTGSGYNQEVNWDAMVRARFNGTNVPVELMGLSVE